MPKKDKVKARDNDASLTSNRVNFLNSKQKKKDSVENQDFQNYESNINDDSNEGITTKDIIQSLEADAQVGAFAVAGNRGGANNEDEETLQDTPIPQTHPSQSPLAVTITSAQLVDDVIVFNDVIVDAIPIKGFCKQGSILRYTLIAIVSLLLLIAIVIPSVILTRKLTSNPSNVDTGSIVPNETRRPTRNPTNEATKSPESVLPSNTPNVDTESNAPNDTRPTRIPTKKATATIPTATTPTATGPTATTPTPTTPTATTPTATGPTATTPTATTTPIQTNKPTKSPAAKAFLKNLQPLLSNTSRQELERPGSSQSLALDWLSNNSKFSAYSFGRKVQRFALALFFFSMQGRSWHNNAGWLTDADECTWKQSSDDNVCVNGTLELLALQNNALKGLIPNDIALLSSLVVLSLYDNALTGSIPSEISALTTLTRLSLYGNPLTGSIPSEIDALTKLTLLHLDYNSLTGSIPSEIGAQMKLSVLSLTGNALTGSIPSEIGALMTLLVLILDSNTLTGSIPSEIGALTTLTWLSLDHNSLTGSIPSEIGTLTALESLYLNNNSLTGSIPSEIGTLTKLEWLSLSSNSLTGSIPSEIGALTKLEWLSLSSNSLTGSIPESLCQQGTYISVDDSVNCN